MPQGTSTNTGQSGPIPRHSQPRAKSAHLVTLETLTITPSKHYNTYNRIDK